MSARPQKYSNYPLRGLIREAPLKTNEKVLLFVIASHEHEKSFATAETLFRQTGLGRTTFYLVRTSLRDRGILGVREAAAGATTYTIHREPLERLIRLASRGLPGNGTPPAAAKHTGRAARRHTTLPSSATGSRTSNKNDEDILNMKPSDQQRAAGPDRPQRRARPVRRSMPRNAAQTAPDDGDGEPTKAAALRARMGALRDRDV